MQSDHSALVDYITANGEAAPDLGVENQGASTFKDFKTLVTECLQGDLTDNLRLRTVVRETFSNVDGIASIFIPVDPVHAGLVDFADIQEWYRKVADETSTSLVAAAVTLLDHLRQGIQILGPGQIGILLVCLENPLLLDPDILMIIMPKLTHIFATLTPLQATDFKRVLRGSLLRMNAKPEEIAHTFRQMVDIIEQAITSYILSEMEGPINRDPFVVAGTQALLISVSPVADDLNEEMRLIPYYEFYNEAIENAIEIKEDYPRWKTKEGFSFCSFSFVLSTGIKGDILKIESMIQMRHELQDAFFRAMFIGVNSPYLLLEVRRDHVIRDALYQLQGKKSHDLKKQLRVTFVGEEGIDEGGVQKEFFQLIVRDMFSATYGMFVSQPDTRLCWFTRDPSCDAAMLEEYTLIGRLIALAIYNGVILDIQFPTALYRKLLGERVDLSDIDELDPILGRGLHLLLSFDGNVEEAFERTFEIDIDTNLGERVSCELCENGANINVTSANREEFVNRYVDFLFNQSVKRQFDAFFEGFNSVMSDSALEIFRPEELQELICGSPTLDFQALESATQYDGYHKDTEVIKYFWNVVHSLTDAEKKLLLFFTTGSDRVPVGGLSKLQFVIARNGGDSDRLPTSHTCFNVLLLNEYSSEEKLRDRLMKAIANSDCGFFLN
ncbi:hypothetical protein BDK51DRAFT_21920 [Blyttiomyces helicus]|uniref:HECT-type E3 ubiquitin transferase n=1 Tax=Blyttiomyces helicus TaxID=388810 RepID=A0A4V1ISL1_9FUNG|nr:hypothetical protein BDK51DRAFT_21920 [Blyttiomyces helicus]|eukprot:RKO93937.1 hypothetical protein BDK51DRAFT_21920 [Blyttiomyces helicus]